MRRMMRGFLGLPVILVLLTGCPPTPGTACKTDDDCPGSYHCDRERGYCFSALRDGANVSDARVDGASLDVSVRDAIADAAARDQAARDSNVDASTDARIPDAVLPLDAAVADQVSVPDAPAGDASPPTDAAPGADTSMAVDAAAVPDAVTPADAGPNDLLPGDGLGDGPAVPDAAVGVDTSVADAVGLDWWFLLDAQVVGDGSISLDAATLGDAGVGSYQGTAEPGVICGDFRCPQADMCCLGLGPSLRCDHAAPFCEQELFSLACDGPEDCGALKECCATGTYSTYCTSVDHCYTENPNNILICVDNNDCRAGFKCCSAQLFTSIGLDIGWCQRSCQ
ncbi:MAG: hypothetical protein ABIJ09_16130 [Pseudomonadota bacterium]